EQPRGDRLAQAVDVRLLVVAEQVVPERHPVLGEGVLVGEEGIDKFLALVRGRVALEGVEMGLGGQQAEHDEVGRGGAAGRGAAGGGGGGVRLGAGWWGGRRGWSGGSLPSGMPGAVSVANSSRWRLRKSRQNASGSAAWARDDRTSTRGAA